MPKFTWQRMLTRWSEAIIASGEFSDVLDGESKTGKWAGFPPASESAIVETERRLSLKLPNSYRQFLKVSNGWWLPGTAGPVRLWPVEEIRPMDPEIAAIWSKGPSYLESESDPTYIPTSHYRSVIQISEDNDGCYLLNPLIKPEPHEWQAAFHAAWIPGAKCHESFASLMKEQFEAFIAAHPNAIADSPKVPARGLNKPPSEWITDPHRFTAELQRLGYFRFISQSLAANMIRDLHSVSEAFSRKREQLLDGPFASPGAVILNENSGRVINVESARLASERGLYAIAMVRPLLGAAGIELGKAEEMLGGDSYGMQLEGISHKFFRLRNGHPALQGGEHEANAARYVMYETAKLLNKVLRQRKSAARIATLENFQAFHPVRIRMGFVLLDDDLSYLLMWSPVIHNYCRPQRPDVFG